MEQNQTPAVFVHQYELACQAARQLSRDRRSNQCHTTETGLKVQCKLDTKTYPKGIVVSEE